MPLYMAPKRFRGVDTISVVDGKRYRISKKKQPPRDPDTGQYTSNSAADVRKRFCSSEGRNVQGRKKGAQLHECKKGKSFSRSS
jgi:hypothetical protein